MRSGSAPGADAGPVGVLTDFHRALQVKDGETPISSRWGVGGSFMLVAQIATELRPGGGRGREQPRPRLVIPRAARARSVRRRGTRAEVPKRVRAVVLTHQNAPTSAGRETRSMV